MRALSKNANINRDRITLEVREGIIRILGFVDTPAEKLIITHLVNKIGGFRRVLNDLHVRSSLFSNDARIAGAILSDMSSYLGLDLSRINVVVKNNTAYLKGFVPTVYMKYAVEKLAKSTPKITRTVNELKILY
jgi:osmotically-inducible protein OsmY